MDNKELMAKEIIGMAVEETINFSLGTKAPIADISYSSNLSEDQPIVIYILFDSIEGLIAMEENHLKDSFMEVFIKAMTREKYPFGDTPRMSFEFSITL